MNLKLVSLPYLNAQDLTHSGIESAYTPLFSLRHRSLNARSLFVEGSRIRFQRDVLTLHCSYAYSANGLWLAASWTDNNGEMLECRVFPVNQHPRHGKSSVPFVDFTSGPHHVFTWEQSLIALWKHTTEIARATDVDWKIVIAAVDGVHADELHVWQSITATAMRTQADDSASLRRYIGKPLASILSASIISLHEDRYVHASVDTTAKAACIPLSPTISQDAVYAQAAEEAAIVSSPDLATLIVRRYHHAGRDAPSLLDIATQLHALSWLAVDLVSDGWRLSPLPFHALVLRRLIGKLCHFKPAAN